MARYMEMATNLQEEVNKFMDAYVRRDGITEQETFEAGVQMGHIVNLAVRCNPRPSQGTVRRNIVAKAVENYCLVLMNKETDEKTGREYNKISIMPK